MYNLCCFKPPPVHLSHVFPQISSSRPPPLPSTEFVTAILLIETFISIRLIVQARLSEFRCAGAERCSWLYIARVVRRLRAANEDERALAASVPLLKSGDTNFCSPASKRVLGEIYHFCPRECEIYAHTSVSQICTSYRRTQVFSRKCRSGCHSGTWNRKFRSLPSYVTAHCQLLHCNKRASSRWLHHAPFLIGEPSSWQVKP